MTFLQSINAWDSHLLVAINQVHSPFWDAFMWAVSAKFSWIALYASILFVTIKKYKKEAWWIIGAFVLCILLADQVSSSLIKPLVHRLRPSHEPSLQGILHFVNNYQGGRYGFVSSHAANSAGFALLSILLLRDRIFGVLLVVWAVFTAYSRMYLAVHYPLDVLFGALVGLVSALAIYSLLLKYRPALGETSSISCLSKVVLYLGYVLSVVGILIYSLLY